MRLAYSCVLIACLLPWICALIAKSGSFGKPRRNGGFDNHNPRQWLAGLQGWQARAHAAQQNGFEALPFFIAGVLLAGQAGADAVMIDRLALAFIACRLGYIGAYLADLASVRSGFWFAGVACCIGLFVVAS